jgi:sodium-dependent phosphate cotransporter
MNDQHSPQINDRGQADPVGADLIGREQAAETGWPGAWALPRLLGGLQRVLVFAVCVLLFVLAIELIKLGAQGAGALIERFFDIESVANALGLGWFAAYLVMSGSPVATVSVVFLDAGVLDRLQALAMIAGSRLGASFIVLFIGFVYVLRGTERRTGLSVGLLALVVTASIYLPALLFGTLLLESRILDSLQLDRGATLSSVLDRALEPLTQIVSAALPNWVVMAVGLAVLWISFYLFDRVLPDLHLKEGRFSKVAAFIYRPLVMFLLGSVITLVTLSVSLSLSLLVPLSARGYVRRENVIPYIMGANITTFADTLLATVILGSTDAFTVVLTSMASVALVSLFVLLVCFRRYEKAALGIVEWTILGNRNLSLFVLAILVTPILLMLS